MFAGGIVPVRGAKQGPGVDPSCEFGCVRGIGLHCGAGKATHTTPVDEYLGRSVATILINFHFFLTDPFVKEHNLAVGFTANDAVKLLEKFSPAGNYYGAKRTR